MAYLPDSEEPEPKYIKNRKPALFATWLFMYTGFIHGLIYWLTLFFGMLDLATAAGCFFWLFVYDAIVFLKLVKSNVMNEVGLLYNLLTILLFSTINYGQYLLKGYTDMDPLLSFALSSVIWLNVINFMIYFYTKSKLEDMDAGDKLDLLFIVVIRGIGWSLFFGTLSYLYIGEYILTPFCFVFGVSIVTYGNRIANQPDNAKARRILLIISSLAMVTIAALYFLVVPDLGLAITMGLLCFTLIPQMYSLKNI